jgi:hypothetical protein
MFHKMMLSAVLAGLLALPVQAAPAPGQGPLAPGQPAGVSQAQIDRESLAVEAGAAALVVGFAVAFAHLAFNVTQTGVSLGSGPPPALASASGVSSTSTR